MLEVPETGSFFVIVDVDAEDDSTGLIKAWEAYKANDRAIERTSERPDSDGWSRQISIHSWLRYPWISLNTDIYTSKRNLTAMG